MTQPSRPGEISCYCGPGAKPHAYGTGQDCGKLAQREQLPHRIEQWLDLIGRDFSEVKISRISQGGAQYRIRARAMFPPDEVVGEGETFADALVDFSQRAVLTGSLPAD